jgi:hypothetical protein
MISAPQDGLSTKKPIDVRAAKVGLAHPQPTLPRYRLHRVLAVDAAHAEVFDFEELLDAVFRAPVNRRMGPMPLSFMPPKGAISPGALAR